MADDHSDEWYFCTRHDVVEPYAGCPAAVRMGPYASREEAGRAYQIAQQRTEAWDGDPRWDDED